MKTLPLVLICLGSGFAGAASLSLLTPSAAQPDGDQAGEISALRGELAALNEQGRMQREMLEDRLARMEDETQLVAPSGLRSYVPEADEAGISDDNLPSGPASGAIRIGNSTIQAEQFEAWVQQASASIAAKKKAQRDQERLIRDGERIEDQVAKLTTDLGLDQHQQSEFRRHLQDSGTKRRDIFQGMRDGTTDRSSMRESMTLLREENDTDLRTFLNDEQFDSYKESNAGNPFGRGGRGTRGSTDGNNSRGGGNRGQ